MAYNYEELYKSNPQALGAPTQVFVDFFETQPLENLRVLDVGCGQGRDALFIAHISAIPLGARSTPTTSCPKRAINKASRP